MPWNNGLTVITIKCQWAIQKTDWIGYWFTPTCLKLWKKWFLPSLRKTHYIKSRRCSVSFMLSTTIGSCDLREDIYWNYCVMNLVKNHLVDTRKMGNALKIMKMILAVNFLMGYLNCNIWINIYANASATEKVP